MLAGSVVVVGVAGFFFPGVKLTVLGTCTGTGSTSDVVATSMGKRTADLVDLAVVETVHRDDLVVLANQ